MPELPEVETVRRGLARTIVGKVVSGVNVRESKIFSDDPGLIKSKLIGAKVETVERRAKLLLIGLSTGWTLAIHLKMTGQLVVVQPEMTNSEFRIPSELQNPKTNEAISYKLKAGFAGGPARSANGTAFAGGHPEKSYDQPLPHKHTRVIITFTDGAKLYFNDLRKFGWMRLLRSSRIPNDEFRMTNETVDEFLNKLELGPEPLGDEFTAEYLARLVARRAIPIKQVLLEQKSIAGIGNIYADEALFEARIHPLRKSSSLTADEARRLYEAIKGVLLLGIEHGGTTMNTYRNVDGGQGRMRDYLKVYGREGEPCLRCGTPIERIKIGQRSSHYCPKCQKKG